ncbi:MAG: DUF3144 domain-containing protein [Pseudomonadota bacterium]|nr:DUF3144 domain-containing protein [Pseudomonadota bacterium]MDQ3229714.1 DUF3144 domain-containing protein [Pseudomonadota bacterium]
MTDEAQTPPQTEQGQDSTQLDPAFFTCVNAFLELANNQAREQGLKRISMATLYATARFNVHGYLGNVTDAADQRTAFLDYMTNMYRRMLNEHLDGIGTERGINVGESELAGEYAAIEAARQGAQPAAE